MYKDVDKLRFEEIKVWKVLTQEKISPKIFRAGFQKSTAYERNSK